MSLAAASLSSLIGLAGPKLMFPRFLLTYRSPATLAELCEKYSRAWAYEGAISSRVLFGPPGAQARCFGALQPPAGFHRRPPRSSSARTAGNPDVDAAQPTLPVRGDVQAQPIG